MWAFGWGWLEVPWGAEVYLSPASSTPTWICPPGPEESPRQEVEAAIRNLQLCLSPGPPDPAGKPWFFSSSDFSLSILHCSPSCAPGCPSSALSSLCPATQAPREGQQPILWAPKWVDYSSKYGFGYQLSDGGSGVLLRDGTHMALRPPESQVCYAPDRGRLQMFALRDVPSPLGTKLAVLRLFASYMQQRLREEGSLAAPAQPAGPSLCLLRYLVSEQALLLLFSDGTLQVSFSADQAQLVLSGGGPGLRLAFWEGARPASPQPLGSLRGQGPAAAARQHLLHALRMLQSV
ncbi:Inactive serine/threonine-protein kinase PLK5 [Galemys pyrenaicus]|uniref:Inactive serine/threonine-protein kinase PLK5 n=1 Tax=Galemys pyrenaicus TaxID=202257 RepID=A0A8J6ACP0_GALPY|nr:Inactive serine/threonine-protein kinase PLK5 [Galemys pyrenaicus]